MRFTLLATLLLTAWAIVTNAQEPQKTLPPIEITGIVPAPIDKVWKAFTTKEGLEAWMVSKAEVDMRNGGLWKTKYGKEGYLGDEGTIVNEVLAVDPGRMYVLRIHTPPKGFPFMNTYRDMWTVVYFDPVEGGKTKITLRAHGFKDNEESKKLRAFFEAGNKYTLDEIVKYFEKQKPGVGGHFTGRATEVLKDGTLVVESREPRGAPVHIRLWGIRMPAPNQPYAKDARERLEGLTVGLEVRVEPRSQDADGTLIAVVTSHDAFFLYDDVDSGNINHILLRDGLARRDPAKDKEDKDLVRHENTARTARRSIWSGREK